LCGPWTHIQQEVIHLPTQVAYTCANVLWKEIGCLFESTPTRAFEPLSQIAKVKSVWMWRDTRPSYLRQTRKELREIWCQT
jgi:hypothetical protein